MAGYPSETWVTGESWSHIPMSLEKPRYYISKCPISRMGEDMENNVLCYPSMVTTSGQSGGPLYLYVLKDNGDYSQYLIGIHTGSEMRFGVNMNYATKMSN